jgi:opacity protein-like surface antigen
MKTLTLLALVLLSSPALADDAALATASSGPLGLEVSLKAGGHFPQLMNPLGTSFDGVLKVGYAPLGNKQIQALLELGYTRPSYTFSGTDPRLGEEGAAYQSTLTVHDLGITLGGAYFFVPLERNLLPYAGAGLTTHLLRYDVEAQGGAAFGAHRETATRLGGVVMGGAGFRLGPGLILGELRVGYAPVAEVVSGVSNVGHLSLMLGYGLML